MLSIQAEELKACLEAVREDSASLEDFLRSGGCDLAHISVCLCRMTRQLDSARAAWGVPPAEPAAAPCPPFTAREREVLHWLAGGKTDKDIGAILGISPRTVHKHLQSIYEKLGVECRTAAVVRALPFLQKGPALSAS